MTIDRPNRGRSWAFWINGLTAGLLVLILAAVALVANPSAPPSIAEFSPQAQQQIEDAPDEQSAESGDSASGAGRETVIIETDAEAAAQAGTAGTVEVFDGVPSALNCVQWPDGSVTQTFDRQSPPCIASWDLDAGNGGATSKGVTGSEIIVAATGEEGTVWADNLRVVLQHFNSSYQLYGRQFRLALYPPVAGTGTADAEQQRQEAIIVAQDIGAFASVDRNQAGQIMVAELAKHKVVSVSARPGIFTRAELAGFAPYAWTSGNTLDAVERNLGEFVCQSLAGDRAEFAGDVAIQQRERQFAILYHEPKAGAEALRVDPLLQRLAVCGLDVPVYEYPADQAQRLVVMQEVQSSGATSLMVSGQSVSYNMLPDATKLGYQPEWIGLGDAGQFSPGAWSNDSAQAAHAFGIASGNKPTSASEDPYSRVIANGGGEPSAGVGGFYSVMSVLAAGVQMAGPNLTPETFEVGLQSTTFPNPGAGQAPAYQASVGFKDDHAMLNDVALWWWDGTRPPAAGVQPGGFCLVGNGTRWEPGTWPSGRQPLFDRGAGC